LLQYQSLYTKLANIKVLGVSATISKFKGCKFILPFINIVKAYDKVLKNGMWWVLKRDEFM